jgi:hypothetical protein
MTDLKKHSQRTAAARAGFSERTARRFNLDPTPPSQRKIHHGRTVADPLEGFWENDLLPLLEELCLNLGDAHFQAARLSVSTITSTPSLNLIPSMTFGN